MSVYAGGFWSKHELYQDHIGLLNGGAAPNDSAGTEGVGTAINLPLLC